MARIATYATYAAVVVVTHLVAMTWHLTVAGAPPAKIAPIVLAIHALPAIGVALISIHRARIGGILIAAVFAAVFAFGAYVHLLSAGPDNVFRITGARANEFRLSVIVIMLLELAGIWVGARAARIRTFRQRVFR